MEKRKRVVKVKKTMRRPLKIKSKKNKNSAFDMNNVKLNNINDDFNVENFEIEHIQKNNNEGLNEPQKEVVNREFDDLNNLNLDNDIKDYGINDLDIKEDKENIELKDTFVTYENENNPVRKGNRKRKTQSSKRKKNKSRYIFAGIGAFILCIVLCFVFSYTILLGAVDSGNTQKYEVTIEEGSTLSDIAGNLKDKELIRSEFAFKAYAKVTGKASGMQAGYYSLSKDQSSIDIISILLNGSNSDTAMVTIKEGLDLNRIATTLEEQGFFTKEEFLSEIKDNKDYYKEKYDFLESVPDDREYILEGYLFADSYNVYANTTPRDLIEKMLNRFDQEYTDEYKQRTKEMGKTIDEIVTMASVVERETILDSELPTVAGVFYNRLENNIALQSCATLQYIYKDYQFTFSQSQMNIDSPYNTYKYPGLPAGPISNFRAEALKAALYPEDTDYLYFCSKNDGTGASAFAKTLEEHEENIAKYSGNWE